MGDETVTNRKKVFCTVRKHLIETRTSSLRDHPYQGKTNTCVAAVKSSCHFFTTSAYTTFKDWRFVHRARLGLLNKLNAYNHSWGHTNKKCHKCLKEETLPHVLNYCMYHSTLYKRRHNAVVDRIKKVALGRWNVISEDRTVGGTNHSPDLVLRKGNDILILDIMCPFENGLEAFEQARKEKEDKYAEITEDYALDNLKVRVEAIIVESLGSWVPKNDKIIRRLYSDNYAKIMRRRIVSETISYYQDVFAEHTRFPPRTPGADETNRHAAILRLIIHFYCI